MATYSERVGTDTSTSMHDLSLVCLACDPDADGTPVYEGEEWGTSTGHLGVCDVCGQDLGLTLEAM